MAPPSSIPLSNAPSLAVTECGATPRFVHVTRPPAATSIVAGRNAKSAASTDTSDGAPTSCGVGSVAGAGTADGVGVGVGRGATGSVPPPAPVGATTSIVPRMSEWKMHRNANVPGDEKVLLTDAPPPITPVSNADDVAECSSPPVFRNATVPPTAIRTAVGS